MNRVISLSLIVFLVVISWQCASNKDFEVTGKLTGAVNDTIELQEMVDNTMKPVKMLYTDESGQFSFTDTASNPRFLFLKLRSNYISLLVLNGQEISLSADLSNFNQSFSISGSRESELIWDLNKEMQSAAIKLDSLATEYGAIQERNPETDNWFQEEYQKLLTEQKTFILSFIDDNYDSPASIVALSHKLGQQSILNSASDFNYFAKVDSSLSSQYPNSTMVKTLHNWVIGQQQQRRIANAQNSSVGIGSDAPEILLSNPDGETIALSSFKGKYVLLDFWAGWCAPCRRESPNLVKAYNKYNDKGFEIYQVSLDKSRDEWLRAIKTDNLTWTQVSDLKFWGSPIAKLYYIKSIPANFLIDPYGKIVAQNLRGQALEEKLNEIYK